MRNSKWLSWAFLLSILASGVSLTACNTVEGVGRDVQAAGDAIEDAADDD